jgi:hypothetical protein
VARCTNNALKNSIAGAGVQRSSHLQILELIFIHPSISDLTKFREMYVFPAFQTARAKKRHERAEDFFSETGPINSSIFTSNGP